MSRFFKVFQVLLLVGLVSLPGRIALAMENPGEELKPVFLNTVLGTQVNLDLPFTSQDGETKPLKEFLIPERPIILIPAYYECPRLCGFLLSGAVKALNDLALTLGRDYQVVTVSFNVTEQAADAKRVADKYRGMLTRSDANTNRWTFLVGSKENVSQIMDQIGFHYIEDKEEYAHTAALMILTPQGEISQYFTGIEFPPRDLRLTLVEASEGQIGDMVDHVLLFCFRFDSIAGKYTWAAVNLMRTGAILTLIILVFFIYRLKRREKAALSA